MNKTLILDIETTPMQSYTWGLYDQTVGVNQIIKDSSILSFAAKWIDQKHIHYMDQRNSKKIEDDKELCLQIWSLLDQADIVIGQNIKAFDTKKINTRFLHHGLKPPSPYRQVDTKLLAKRSFAFPSNSLEYMSERFCAEHKKTKSCKFHGFELWTECMKGNTEAFKEMEKYNKLDVLSTEELYKRLDPYLQEVRTRIHSDPNTRICNCGSTEFKKKGLALTNTGQFQRYRCKQCGAHSRDSVNLLTKEQKKNLLKQS